MFFSILAFAWSIAANALSKMETICFCSGSGGIGSSTLPRFFDDSSLKVVPVPRSFNFETLATYVYQYASDELLQESSFAALIIVVVGLML